MNSEQYSYSRLYVVQSERVICLLALYDMILWPLTPPPLPASPQPNFRLIVGLLGNIPLGLLSH